MLFRFIAFEGAERYLKPQVVKEMLNNMEQSESVIRPLVHLDFYYLLQWFMVLQSLSFQLFSWNPLLHWNRQELNIGT